MKIATILGARPQFIKAAPVSKALADRNGIEEVLVHTGQHFDAAMSDVFFREMAIPEPRHHLGIGGLAHGAMTGRMLEAIEGVLLAEKPEWVMVYGDTNSTLAGALAAAKLKIPVAHVEAGLRSFNRAMPEEINRVVADHVSTLLFAPTDTAVRNLLAEGVARPAIALTGDVMFDAALIFAGAAEQHSRVLQRLGLTRKGYLLATVHRAENTDNAERLGAVFRGLAAASAQHPVVLPLHPRTKAVLVATGFQPPQTLRIVEPVGFLDMVMLEKHARLIATDSGGVQKEAFFHKVPCVTLREETEWVELIDIGANRLAPPRDAGTISEAIAAALDTPEKVFINEGLYGDGNAAQKIAARLAAD
ncbi:MAG TPA: UDP-N-acetylglucosamine 2-epimerase (non-hydrolyzing) [Burkholderiales bacterium]|nr:UDP-N-acetylglucosamine 2-epimerase (non-hydrolyzing) [Burkholderiales bacterium]